jgi:AraC-like DNA-binding protein
VGAVERIVFSSRAVEIGAFRCTPQHASFRHEGSPIRDHHSFAFPRTRVSIRHDGARPFTADANVVTLYNPRQSFAREPLDPRGDVCEFFAVDNDAAGEVARSIDPALEATPDRAFRFSHAPSDAATYLAQRQLFLGVARGEWCDPLAVEERVLWLLRRVLESGYRAWRSQAPPRGALSRREKDAAAEARALLGERLSEPLALADIARTAGLSRFRLCRAFRRETGTTMHDYREQLRLRAALEALASPAVDLTGLALDLGYSSHSHFTSRFRRAFGAPPSEVRGRIARLRRAS